MSLPHDSAATHVTGASEYIDDRPPLRGELLVGVVFSPHAHAKIRKIDTKKAQAVPGVAGIFTFKDLAHNLWGTIFQDQPLLAEKEVNFVGEPVAIVAGESRRAVDAAVALVKVDYQVLPALLTIAAAKKVQSFIGSHRKIERGDVESTLKNAPNRLEGSLVIRGQDHFYLESQAAVAYPKEDGQIEVHSSAQHPTEVQHVVAHGLGIPDKDVVSIVKRMGGAFGGKESQAAPFAAFAALVAQKLKRPARLILTKDDDMIMTGKRNPFETSYRVGFDKEGRILALDVELFSDGGAYADLSTSIMERAMLHCDNAYYIPVARIQGRVCRTHFHPHTAFRGFGGPKGVATIERILEEIAHFLDVDSLEVRKRNCYGPGRDTTPYGQVVENNCLPALFAQIEKDAEYAKRRKEIAAFNAANLPTLRGLSTTAVKFGISFTTRFLNQGNALVIIHRDGTLQVSTGATEMGQGVNARVSQVVADELGLTRDRIRVMPTTTDKNANTSPTAASSGTDLNAAAALIATKKLKARLGQIAARVMDLPEARWARNTAGLGTEEEVEVVENREVPGLRFENGRITLGRKSVGFDEVVHEAYHNRISLSEYAHYRVPNLAFNKLTGQGRPFFYFTQGVATSEVQVDRRTGEIKVVRVDILMDLGRPINEELDLGQIWGGFVQGMGWVTTENLVYSPEGLLLSHSPSTYKIPSVQDTPRTFNVKLIPNDGNAINVRGTKAVGEPPLLLGLSVWTAVQDALRAPHKPYPRLAIPATQESVLRALLPERFQQWE